MKYYKCMCSEDIHSCGIYYRVRGNINEYIDTTENIRKWRPCGAKEISFDTKEITEQELFAALL